MVREFLKKYFPPHMTDTLRRHILDFEQKENGSFFSCLELFNELLQVWHHSYEIWRVISFFYDGLSSQMQQFKEMILNGFRNKDPEEAWDYLESLAEHTQPWDALEGIEKPKKLSNPKGA